jgi:multiple sugar transport system substrate-binding protein
MNKQMLKATCLMLVGMVALSACTSSTKEVKTESIETTTAETATATATVKSGNLADAPFEGWVEGLPKIQGPEGYDWKQYAGTELKLISENTPPSSALAEDIKKFEDATGIKVKIEQYDLDVVVEKIGLDFNAKSANYQVIYADPYQTLPKNSGNFIDLNTFNNDPALPHIPGGLEDFFESHMQVNAYMGDDKRLLTLPYDTGTQVLAYRKDVFTKYKDQFQKEKGFDWTPGPNLTWEQYYEAAKWISEKVKSGVITEVKYGTGHMAKQYDSLMADFSNILSAYGGDYYKGDNLGTIGAAKGGKSLLTSPESIEAAKFYKKLIEIAAPGSKSWDWSGLAEAFAAGDVALAPEFHEFSSMFENPDKSKIAGEVGWATLPKGPKRSANLFGGTGIGISKYASEKEQKAAWLLLIWSTSPQSEYATLKSAVGGSTPARHSVYNLDDVKRGMEPGTPESKQMPNLLPMKATLEAWKAENMYMRPKIPQWPIVDTYIFTELSKMLADKSSPENAMKEIAKKSDELMGN